MGREPPACSTRHWNPMNRTSLLDRLPRPRLAPTRSRANGFTLMELLIVMAIILILMLMAIPTIGSLTKKGDETSAINSIQAMTKAEMQYESTYPANGYACTLAALGGDPKLGRAFAYRGAVPQGDLTSGYKHGYIFAITTATR